MVTSSVTNETPTNNFINKFAAKSDFVISSIPISVYFVLILVGVLAVGQATYYYYNQEPYNNLSQQIVIDDVKSNAYGGNVLLGLSPNTYPRQPTEKDIDTKLNIKAGDAIYRLYESRSLETFDYGKTFAIRIV